MSVIDRLADLYRANDLPLRLHLDLTFRCPLRCPHCYISGQASLCKEMNTRQILRLLREAREMRVLFLLVSGGEPMLRPDFFEVLEAARRLGFYLHIKTTGIYLNRESAERIARLGPVRVDLSVHGAKAETHDRFVGVEGAFEKTVAAFEVLRAYGIRLGIRTAVVLWNAHEISEIEDRFALPGVDFRKSFLLSSRRDGTRPFEEFELDVDTCLKMAGQAQGSIKLNLNQPLCGAASATIYVGPDGTVFPCAAWPERIGNAGKKGGLMLAYHSERARQIRQLRTSDREKCLSCPAIQLCPFCPGESFAEGLPPTAPNLLACRYAMARMRLEVSEDHGQA